MPSSPLSDFEALSRRFRYEPETGHLIRLRSRGKYLAGSIAGSKDDKGYLVVNYGGRPIGIHRVAVLLMTGEWPAPGLEVDHKDGDKVNNRWLNLRQVTRKVNAQNIRRAHRDNKHPLGVGKNGSGFLAQIMADGVLRYLGTYRSPEEAHAAYVAAKRQHHAGCTL